MADFTFECAERTEFGKGFARRARMAGLIPAVIYGAGKPAIHITLPAHETANAVRMPNALFEIKVGGKTHQALVKDIQREFVSRNIEHLDLLAVKAGERVDARVKLNVNGNPVPGAVASVSLKSIVVKTEATSIPRSIELNIDGANPGDHFTVADISLPEGVVVSSLPESHVVVAVKARAVRKNDAAAESAPAEGGESSDSEDKADEKSSDSE